MLHRHGATTFRPDLRGCHGHARQSLAQRTISQYINNVSRANAFYLQLFGSVTTPRPKATATPCACSLHDHHQVALDEPTGIPPFSTVYIASVSADGTPGQVRG